jgi:hypothetical protein
MTGPHPGFAFLPYSLMTFVFELLLTASCFCLQGASPNRPLGKTKKSGSKFDLQQDSSAVLYRVSAYFSNKEITA